MLIEHTCNLKLLNLLQPNVRINRLDATKDALLKMRTNLILTLLPAGIQRKKDLKAWPKRKEETKSAVKQRRKDRCLVGSTIMLTLPKSTKILVCQPSDQRQTSQQLLKIRSRLMSGSPKSLQKH